MKTLLSFAAIVLCLPALAFGQVTSKGVTMYGIAGMVAAGVSPFFSEDFTTADTGDVAGNTDFDSETDAASLLSIVSNEMVVDVGTNASSSYVTESWVNEAGSTVKFKIKFADILAVDNGTSSTVIANINNSAGTRVGQLKIFAAATNIASYRAVRGANVEDGNSVTMTGLTADTWYDAVAYTAVDATTGGISFQIGAWDESNTGFNDDNSAGTGVGQLQIGCTYNGWGDGTTDTTILYDDVEIYSGDRR